MTHDPSLFNLTKRRVINNGQDGQWQFKEIYAAESSDGIPQPFIPNSDDYLELAKKYINKFDFPAGVNYLRKEAERLLKSLLPVNLIYSLSDQGCKTADLELLMDNFKKNLDEYGGDFGPFKKLKEYKDLLLNPLSHDNIHTPVYKSEAMEIVEILILLRKMSFRKLIDITVGTNEVVFIEINDSTGLHWTYTVRLLENYYWMTLIDQSGKLGNPLCDFIERTNPTLDEPLPLKVRRMKLAKGYGQIRHALGIAGEPVVDIAAILRNSNNQYLVDLLLAIP